jgi:hypothetical protein
MCRPLRESARADAALVDRRTTTAKAVQNLIDKGRRPNSSPDTAWTRW